MGTYGNISLREFGNINLNNDLVIDILYNWNGAEEKYMYRKDKVDFRELPDEILNAIVLDWFIVNENTVEVGIDYYE